MSITLYNPYTTLPTSIALAASKTNQFYGGKKEHFALERFQLISFINGVFLLYCSEFLFIQFECTAFLYLQQHDAS